jgi:hypothetical protein
MRASVPRSLWLGLIFVLALVVSGCTSATSPGALFVPAQPATPAATATAATVAQPTPEPPVPEVTATLTPTEMPSPTSQASAPVTETESLPASPTPGVTPTEHVHPTATAEASAATGATPVETAAEAGILFQDDFTDPGSGWQDNLEFGSYYIGYHEPEYYHVEVHTPHDRALVAIPNHTFDDFTVESQAFPDPNNTAQTGDFRYGLFFRREGNQYYAFVVSPRTKTWYVLKSSPTGLTELKRGTEASIHDVPGADALRVDVKGPSFFFHINDHDVAEVSDTDYASGEVGFYVETLDAPRVHIHYDTITVRKVEAAPPANRVLYQDDFTDPGSGWQDNLEFGSYYIGYHEPEYYHVEVHTPYDRALVAVPKEKFDDFTLESQAFPNENNTAQTGDFRYGLFFRREGNQYYAFVVSPRTKTWYVLKSSPTGLTELKKGTEASIHDIPGADALRVDAKGPTLFFHINDQTVAGVSDADYASGEVGFYVETFDAPRVHIHYDTISVLEAETPQLECTVATPALHFRKGPGTTYAIITSLAGGVHFEPLARSADGLWINARPEGGDQTGWVASSPELVSCNTSVDTLPPAP